MLSRIPLGPTLALKIMVFAVGCSDEDPGMLLFDGIVVKRGLSRFKLLISDALFDSCTSVLLG